MTPAPATIPIRPEQAPVPKWTITGVPSPEAIRGWAALCLDIARKRLAERAAGAAADGAAEGDKEQGEQHKEQDP